MTLPSMKLADILARVSQDPPIDRKDQTPEQLAVLHAYGCSQAARTIGEPVTLRLIASYATSGIGYVRVERPRVEKVIWELREQGWILTVDDMTGEAPVVRAPRAKKEPTVKTPVVTTTERSDAELRPTADGLLELVGNVELTGKKIKL